jgi:hypothetical protein
MLFSSEHALSVPIQLLCDILAKGRPLENSREYSLKYFVQRLLPDETRITEKSRKFAQSAKRWAEQNPDEATRILIKRNPLAALRFVTLVGKRMEAETEQEFKKACYEDKDRKRFWVRYCARFAFVADNHNQILLDSFGDTDRNSRGATKEYISGIQRRKREALEKLSEFMTLGNLTPDRPISELLEMLQ